MQCRDISDRAFEAILAELTIVEHRTDAIESVSGRHQEFGVTVLLRDGHRCMALVEDPSKLDRVLAQIAFAADGSSFSCGTSSGRQ